MSYYNKDRFIKNRKSFNVAPYALADVIEALTNDYDNLVDICVTKEDGHLVVMFNRELKPSRDMNGCDGSVCGEAPPTDEPLF